MRRCNVASEKFGEKGSRLSLQILNKLLRQDKVTDFEKKSSNDFDQQGNKGHCNDHSVLGK